MKKNEELLISIYQNAKTGTQSIEDLLPKVKDKDLKEELKNEQIEFEKIASKCEQMARNEKITLKENSFMEKAKMWTSIKMSTMFNSSNRKIAELMLIGCIMGTLQCYKDLVDYKEAKEPIKELARILHRTEEKFFENLKEYLKPTE